MLVFASAPSSLGRLDIDRVKAVFSGADLGDCEM
jgi:hypothetical protein